MKGIYFTQFYLEPGMFFDFNHHLIKFIREKLNEMLHLEKVPFRKGMKTDTSDYSLILWISCHADEFVVKGPTVSRKEQEICFYLNIPYKAIPHVREQAIYFLDYVKLGLIDILQEDADKYDLQGAIDYVKNQVLELDEESKEFMTIDPYKTFNDGKPET